jgi:sulfatase modifying factor 1
LNPNLVFDDGTAIYNDAQNSPERKHVKIHHGVFTPDFRLPTEAEWEYAAKAVIENREYNTIRGRKKYPWNGKYTRNKSKSKKGDQLANFKQGKGDYSGIAGWSSDGADITNKIKSYPPNAFGLYDMAGNVAEWVFDVYRPIIDAEMNDFNYARGNLFLKKVIDQNGKVNIANYEDLLYDTLPNGKLVPKNIPGKVMFVPITKEDSKLRFNYQLANNASVNDGDLKNSRYYRKEAREITEKSRMYNAPLLPKSFLDEESRSYRTEYDKQLRTTAIDDQSRVYKGGSWKDREFWLDPAQRRFFPQYMGAEFIGFRCALDKLGPMGNGKKTPFYKK